MKRILLLLAFATVAINFIYGQNAKKADFEFPNPVGFVNDYEKVFTDEEIDSLKVIIKNHQNETTNQIAIITIDSYAPYETLFDYSLNLFNTWGIGTKEKNNGVAIVFGKKMREIRIMVGYGLEKQLTNKETQKIINDSIIPEFKKGNYYGGIKNGLFGIIEEIK